MKWCKHKVIATTLFVYRGGGADRAKVRVCKRCRTWLPIGPSNDSPPEVQAEMRAAELAAVLPYAHANEDFNALTSFGERRGWAEHRADDRLDIVRIANLFRSEEAGYLARCIATHQPAQRDEEGK